MVQRSRFTAQLYPKTATTPGTFGFLLGDTANAIHFWPGRGLNSGLASAISLARCLAATWEGTPLRDADFVRHEAVMAMLQYRHKSRAWRQMVTTDAAGNMRAIKDQIALGIAEGDQGTYDRNADLEALIERMGQIRRRLESRIDGLPDDDTLQSHLERLPGPMLHTLLVSEPWDTGGVGGEEVDVEWLLKPAAASRTGLEDAPDDDARPVTKEHAMKASARRNGSFTHRIEVRGHQVTADEPTEHGGANEGPSPQELLAVSIASCTAVTMEMYANRKGWDIGQIEVDCEYETPERGSPTHFNLVLRLPDSCTEEQVDKLRVDRRQVSGAPRARGASRPSRNGSSWFRQRRPEVLDDVSAADASRPRVWLLLVLSRMSASRHG